ncbi:Acyl-CoA thioesterase [Teratosphaeria destructans]|uniref:Acyl-CoA thioesterase n=1 Tax=Teratosphaeria destructans TaxID=418781 RepID=A0A9W7W6T1_9PEZI|nr:Acyl-CoA thioesterase [Teratosphaeria destructans]
MIEQLRNVEVDAHGHVVPARAAAGRPEVGMMVSLDHTIYFHRPLDFRADDWIFTECESPWAGDGRGLVHQRMYTREGVLIATCIQEGLVRLKQDTPSASKL